MDVFGHAKGSAEFVRVACPGHSVFNGIVTQHSAFGGVTPGCHETPFGLKVGPHLRLES